MAATAQEKFDAAVKVIRGLPKHGSFQPSYELMLKFYAYYKQATEGPCTASKPGIWNLVNRKKWDAWSGLGEMPKEQAMLLYVEELKNIVEMMPQTEQVAEFVQTLDNFYELVEEGPGREVTKVRKLPYGSAVFNGSGDGNLNHSETIGEMLRINNNDLKADDGHADTFNSNGSVYKNGSREGGQRDEEEEEEEDEDADNESKKAAQAQDFARVDSGSDTDEFCDTSDQPVQAKAVTAVSFRSELNAASTPVDARKEARVRFAPDLHQRSPVNSSGTFDMIGSNTSINAQLMSERLGLGSPAGISFLPHTTDFPPRHLTDSLFVNNSCSSLVSLVGEGSLVGDASMIGNPSMLSTDFAEDSLEDESTLDGGLSFVTGGDLVTSRGGGDEEGVSTQGQGGSYSVGFGGGSGYAGSRRDVSHSTAGSSRRGLFPPGSGGGGQRRDGDGRDPRGGSGLEEQMLVTLLRLQQDMVDVMARLSKLEAEVRKYGQDKVKRDSEKKSVQPGWWPFPGMSKKMAFFIFVWPLLVPFIINLLCRRRRGHSR